MVDTDGERHLLVKIVKACLHQTYGWIDKTTIHRKSKDKISQSQFIAKTGLCKRVISKGLQSLISKGLITVSDQYGNSLLHPLERKGVSWLYYSFKPAHFVPPTSAQNVPSPVHKSALYKTNYTKLNKTKLKVKSVGEIIALKYPKV